MMNFSRFMNKHKFEIIFYTIVTVFFFMMFRIGYAVCEKKYELTEPVFNQIHETVETSLGTFKVTAYCPCSECCGKYSDGYTATMTKATPGRTVAVDPDVIPYGTEVIIDGETYIAEDCGGAVLGKHIDIMCASHELAEAWGVQYKDVTIKTERIVTEHD